MTIQLPEDVENSIIAKVNGGLFSSMDAAMTEAARLLLERIELDQAASREQAPGQVPAPADKPIWDRVLERTADIPDAEWEKLPTDLAERHDHYLYGSPERPEG